MKEALSRDVDAAVRVLRTGGLVAFPTETVYGLGADACNPAAVRRIFEVKGRPPDHPLIVHFARLDNLDHWTRNVPDAAWRLAERFWPGPLTLILRRRNAPLEVTGGQETVGVRMPDHPLALALLEAFGGGVAAPSANRFGRVSPTRARHVRKELKGKVDMILDGGPCRVGVESTILCLAGSRPRLLRPGSIPLSALQEVLGEEISEPGNGDAIRAPGMLPSHYAPETPLEVWPLEHLKRRGKELARSGVKAAAILIEPPPSAVRESPNLTPFPMPVRPADYAQRLYAVLHLLDLSGFDVLLAQSPPDTEPWRAVNDRLRRASRGR